MYVDLNTERRAIVLEQGVEEDILVKRVEITGG